jgi:hypothetical protein
MRSLARRVESGAAARGFVLGERSARLDRIRHQAVVDQLEARDMRGFGERGVDLLAALPEPDLE